MGNVSLINGHIDGELTDNEIIKALECCTTNGASCKDCPAFVKVDRSNCKKYFRGALDLINRLQAEKEELQELVNEMSDYFPACIGCEGKTEDGVRTDKCVFLIDKTNYCVKRGISNIVAIRKENAELKADIENYKQIAENQQTVSMDKEVEIKRLKAEVERLCAEIDELIISKDLLFDEAEALIRKAKTEAVKEFADKAIDRVEKVKEKYQRLCKEQGEEMEEHMHIHFNGIINLLKEMVGE